MGGFLGTLWGGDWGEGEGREEEGKGREGGVEVIRGRCRLCVAFKTSYLVFCPFFNVFMVLHYFTK